MSQAHDINGELLKLRREERGWAQSDMATRACMSVKQIRQLEEGGISAFYSESVKIAAAKKVAGILGLTADQVWVMPETQPEPEHEVAHEAQPEVKPAEPEAAESQDPVQTEVANQVHEDKKPPVQSHQSQVTEPEAKPKTSMWLIAGLFGAALAVAAYMRPEAEPVATEPPPPLQVVPSEAAEPASGASAAVDAASAPASETVASKVAASASVIAPAVTASKPAVAASAVATSAPKPVIAASAAVVARPASAAVVAPAASSASK